MQIASSAHNGMVVSDLQSDARFQQRMPHDRDPAAQLTTLHRLLITLAGTPETVLQEVVNAAVDMCGADSAGVSLEREDGTDEAFYKWVVTAGEYARHRHAMLPRRGSPTGICLERGRAQRFTVSQRFYEWIGMAAADVTDGILVPWHAGKTRGTMWIVAHGREEAFDREDYRIMAVLADCVTAGIRQQQQHALELARAEAAGGAMMAREVAQKLKGPLQTARAVAYLVERSRHSVEAKLLAEEMSVHLEELSAIVKGLSRTRVRGE